MFKRNLLLSATILSAAIITAPAYAQTADEIIVTATKRTTTLQDTPVAIDVVGAQQIEQAQILDILDLQSVTPSFRVSQLQNSANSTLIIRGFGNGGNNLGIEPSVGLYIDGVYRSRAAAQIADLPNLDRIEVLKGPQSILFGKNASAGVVSIVTQKPQQEVQGYVEAGIGNFDFFQGKYYLTGGITDNLAVSIGGSFQQRDGTFDIVPSGDENAFNDRNRWNINLQALWEPTDQTSFRLIYDQSQLLENCCGTSVALEGPLGLGLGFTAGELVSTLGGAQPSSEDPFGFETFVNLDTENDIDDSGLSLEVEHDFGAFTATSITSYRENEAGFDSDSDFNSLDLLASTFQEVSIDTFTQEFRLASNGDNFVDWLVGGFFFDETLEQDSGLVYGEDLNGFLDAVAAGLGAGPGFFAATGGNLPVQAIAGGGALGPIEAGLGLAPGTFFGAGQGINENYVQDNQNWSIFGTVDINLTDRFTLTGGLNYTEDDKDVTTNILSTDVFSNLELQGPVGEALLVGGGISPFIVDTFIDLDLLGVDGFGPSTALLPSFDAFFTANPGALSPALVGAPDAVIAGAIAGARADIEGGIAGIDGLLGLQFQPFFVNIPNAVESGQTRDSDLSFTVRGAYEINDNFNAYATYATGFKASSFNLTRDSRPATEDGQALEAAGLLGNSQILATGGGFGTRFAGPEETRVIELGLKGKFENGAFNIAAFDQEIQGFQSAIFLGTGFALQNAGQQSSRGVEFDGTYNPFEALTLTAAVTYLDAEFDDFTGAAPNLRTDDNFADPTIGDNVSSQDLSGQRPAGIPEIALSLGANYGHDFGNGITGFIQGDWQFESNVQVVDNIVGIDREVSQFNASIGIGVGEHFDFRIWGRNLGDDQFFTSAFPGVVQFGTANAYPNQPRTFGGSARFSF